MTDEEITKLIAEIFEKTNFVANISIVLPLGDIKALLNILPTYSDFFRNNKISWRVTKIKDDGILLEIDKTNYPHWERKKIIMSKEIDGDVE